MPGAQNVFHEALPIVFAKLVQEEPFSKLFDTESYTHFNFIYLFIFCMKILMQVAYGLTG